MSSPKPTKSSGRKKVDPNRATPVAADPLTSSIVHVSSHGNAVDEPEQTPVDDRQCSVNGDNLVARSGQKDAGDVQLDLAGGVGELTNDRRDSQVEEWQLCDLKPHKLQEQFFGNESEEADLDLAADMQKNGLKCLPEILPDGKIISGHRRIAAARHNGWKTVDVMVRYDLVGNDAAIEQEFLSDNFLRRHLSPLQQARCAKRLQELASGGKLTVSQQGKTRDKIGRLLDVSGKTVERWLRILKAPLPVQLAFDAGKLGIEEAARVSGLTKKDQEKIAAEIKNNGDKHAKAIVQKYLPKRSETVKGPGKTYIKFMRAIKEALKEDLHKNTDKIGWQPKEHSERLSMAKELVAKLQREIESIHEDDAEEAAA